MYSGCVAQPPHKIANQTINISAERYFHLFHHCIIVRNTNRNWHTLGQGIETSGRSSVKRNVYPIIWPYMPIAKYPVPGPTHKVSVENLRTRGSVRTNVND
jgi:hypothetical protein